MSDQPLWLTLCMPSETGSVRRRLSDILFHIDLAASFCSGAEFATFEHDVQRLYAVTRCLEIISEASRRLTDELKARHPNIPWREMAAAGNVYRHEYQFVAPLRVWETVRDHLPRLRQVVEQELMRSDEAGDP